MRPLNLTQHLKFLICISLLFAFSCKKSTGDNQSGSAKGTYSKNTKNNTTQFGIYALGFQEDDLNQDLSIVIVMETPDKELTVQNYSFRFNEKDSEKIRTLSNLFFKSLMMEDKNQSKGVRISDYINSFFESTPIFKQALILSDSQLSKLIAGSQFYLAKNGNSNINLFSELLHAFVPTANAQATGRGVIKNVYGMLGGAMLIALTPAELSLGALLAVTVGGNFLLDQATGNEFNSNAFLTGQPGNFAYILFGSGQTSNFLKDLLNPVNQALNLDGAPSTRSPESLEDIIDQIWKVMYQRYKDATSGTPYLIATDDATSITSNAALIGGSLTCKVDLLPTFFKGVTYSSKGDPIYSGTEIAAGKGVGHFSVTLTNLSPHMTYYFRAHSYYYYGQKNTKWDDYGPLKEFTTDGDLNIGDEAFGGIIFYLDNTKKHGMVESSCGISNKFYTSDSWPPPTASTSTSFGSGITNTQNIYSSFGTTAEAVMLCRDFRGGGFKDWYLPSLSELSVLYDNLASVNKLPNLNNYAQTSSFYNFANAYIIHFPGKQTYPSSLSSVGVTVLGVRNF